MGDGIVGVGDVGCGSSNSSSQREVNMVGASNCCIGIADVMVEVVVVKMVVMVGVVVMVVEMGAAVVVAWWW